MFTNRLTLKLTLSAEKMNYVVQAGNIKKFSLDWQMWGFQAQAVFWVVSQESQSEDTLFSSFISQKPIKVKIEIDRTFDKVGEKAGSIQLEGVIEYREVLERAFPNVTGEPVLHRRYTIRLRDAAAVYWSQHFPTVLLTDATHESLIKQETPIGLTVKCTYAEAKQKHSMLALGLGANSNQASFYDVVLWLAQRAQAGLLYDGQKNIYTLTDQKPKGSVETIPVDDVQDLNIIFSEPLRHDIQILNSSAEAPSSSKKASNPDAYSGVRRDIFLNTPLSKHLDERLAVEKSNIGTQPSQLKILFLRYPSITIAPANLYNFKENWSKNIYSAKNTYRLVSFRLEAKAEGQAATDDVDQESNTYHLEAIGQFENQTEAAFAPIPFTPPEFPFHVEGKIVSDTGTATEATYQIYEDTQTKIEHHLVMTYPFKKKIRVPIGPAMMPGHFYFPPYRDQRVQLRLGFDHAQIEQYLDWRPGARLPKESQGNHIMLGKEAEDHTSLRHTYVGSKPILTIERTFGKDLQTIEVSEGKIRFETKGKS